MLKWIRWSYIMIVGIFLTLFSENRNDEYYDEKESLDSRK
jgi:hypothetical protein